MILTCPSCATRYLIDPVALGATGRVVRCARCSHSWTELPPEDMPKRVDVILPPEEVRPIPPGSNLPALRDQGGKTAWVGWMILAVVVAGVLGGGVYARDQIITLWPEAAQMYTLLGLDEYEATRGLEVRNLNQSSFFENEVKVVVVTGDVVNVTNRSRDVPKIIIEILDKENRIIDSWLVTPANTKLGPGESTTFSDRFTDPPENAVQVMARLDGGN